MGFMKSVGKFLGGPIGGFLGGPVGAIAGSVVSGMMQKKEASKNRAFQQDMSSTAHVREVEDLKKAGLNPILSAGGRGASTPSGAQAQLPDLGKTFTTAAMMKANVANTNAIASTNAVDAKWANDLYDFYSRDPSIKRTVLSGMLSAKTGVGGVVGAVLGASSSARYLIPEFVAPLPKKTAAELEAVPHVYKGKPKPKNRFQKKAANIKRMLKGN